MSDQREQPEGRGEPTTVGENAAVITSGIRAVRREAKRSCAALLDLNLSLGEGDLWLSTEDYNDEQLRWFSDEVRRIIERLQP